MKETYIDLGCQVKERCVIVEGRFQASGLLSRQTEDSSRNAGTDGCSASLYEWLALSKVV